ncbi:hypothetical protein MCEMSHM24_02735 [Comamonadaceae bacterium]
MPVSSAQLPNPYSRTMHQTQTQTERGGNAPFPQLPSRTGRLKRSPVRALSKDAVNWQGLRATRGVDHE